MSSISSGYSSTSSTRPSSPLSAIPFKPLALPPPGFYASLEESRIWAPPGTPRPNSAFTEYSFDDERPDLDVALESSDASASSSLCLSPVPVVVNKTAESFVAPIPALSAPTPSPLEQAAWLEDRKRMTTILKIIAYRRCPACLTTLNTIVHAIAIGEGVIRSLSASGTPENITTQARNVRAQHATAFYGVALHCLNHHHH